MVDCTQPKDCACQSDWNGPACNQGNVFSFPFSDNLECSNDLAVCTPSCINGICTLPNFSACVSETSHPVISTKSSRVCFRYTTGYTDGTCALCQYH